MYVYEQVSMGSLDFRVTKPKPIDFSLPEIDETDLKHEILDDQLSGTVVLMRRSRRPYISARPPHTRIYMGQEQLLEHNNNSNDQNNSTNDPGEQATPETENNHSNADPETYNRHLPECSEILGARGNPIANVLDTLGHFTEEGTGDEKYGRILRSIREVISCCACFSSESMMKECINGHLLCQNCFLTLRQDERPQCPTCRASLYSDSRRALVAQKVLSELPDYCADCHAPMLHKSLANHRLNYCPRRRVACGLSALGCEWTGTADQYDSHFRECLLHKQLSDQPLGNNLEMLLSRFKKREQSMRETFQCFSNMLRHLEAHELQTVTVTLANVSTTEAGIHYRSDHFHINQSRWTAEIMMNFPSGNPIQITSERDSSSESANPNPVNPGGLPINLTMPSEGMSSRRPDYPLNSEGLQSVGAQAIRRRRWHHGGSVRHHPYLNTFAMPAIVSGAPNVSMQQVTQLEAATPTQSVNRSEESPWIGEITYRLTKENSPGIGRRSYAFALLLLKVPDTGIQIFARPQIQTYRFTNRGDLTATFPIYPIRWRYISSLREMSDFRLIQADFVIARRIVDDHVES
ncbi:unnamed protein product [Calicophoron daubneyi]|uniref:Uncharacterized protein n=1 Tax=Calicophoron daubneyi TaxID=300641 RepID=A0AAV2T2J8_CALDB